MDFSHFQLVDFLIFAVSIMVGLTIHEYAHARMALACGDDTAQRAGRVSLNPLDHLDLYGSIMMVVTYFAGFGIGWAKPVPINPANLKHPRTDEIKISAWGPLSNILLACFFAAIFRLFGRLMPISFLMLTDRCIFMNLVLAFFNIIPVSPLDGSHVLSALLPVEMARQYDAFMMRFGILVLIILLFSGAISLIIGVPTELVHHLLIGIS
jgi:Zn-dependent protease